MSEIDRYTEQELKRLQTVLIRSLQYCGEQVLNKARSTNSYKDQTGNLRSSLGYVVAVDGRVVYQSDFQTVKQGRDGSEKGARGLPDSCCGNGIRRSRQEQRLRCA